MELQLISYRDYIGGKSNKIFQFSVYGKNRDQSLLEWQKKVFDKFGRPINQIYIPFEQGYSHGQGIDLVLNNAFSQISDIDYVIIWDDDAIPLRRDYLEIAFDKIKYKDTIFGNVEQSNHIKKFDGTYNHPYIGTSPFCISVELLKKLGYPSFDHCNEGDRAEKICLLAEENGYCLSMVWPSNVIGLNEEEMIQTKTPTSKSLLGQNRYFGFGVTYGENFSYHQMCAPAKRHSELFIKKCQEVLNG